ncbi:MAG: DUF309 domain-containing protein [Acidobacteriota bacterium]
MLDFKPDPRYQMYWRHFRTGRFWEAHEVLEDLWMESEGRDKVFYQGLIQAAACLHHLERGNLHGAERLAGTAREKLESVGTSYRGLQIESLLMGLHTCLEDARPGAGPGESVTSFRLRIPRVDLAFGVDAASTTD